MTTSFGAVNSAIFNDPKLQIPSFSGLRLTGLIALQRTARRFSVSSSNSSIIRAVSTVNMNPPSCPVSPLPFFFPSVINHLIAV